MKFKFECEEEGRTVSVEFDAVLLYEVVDSIQTFLKACGFQLENLDYDVPSS